MEWEYLNIIRISANYKVTVDPSLPSQDPINAYLYEPTGSAKSPH